MNSKLSKGKAEVSGSSPDVGSITKRQSRKQLRAFIFGRAPVGKAIRLFITQELTQAFSNGLSGSGSVKKYGRGIIAASACLEGVYALLQNTSV
jgi:hypothetical protein